jgi:Flp pilus assembly protein TadG
MTVRRITKKGNLSRNGTRRLVATRRVGGPLSGQSLVEALIVLPVLFLVVLNAINFGLYIFGWITVNNAARAAAEYKVYNGVVLGANGGSPANSAVQTFAKSDAASLPSSSTLVSVTVCSNFNGSASCSPNNADPEPATYKSWTIGVTYSYSPIVSSLTLPVINVPLTIPATSISRQVVMRSMQ